MEVTLSGITILVKVEHSEKVSSGISTAESGIITVVIALFLNKSELMRSGFIVIVKSKEMRQKDQTEYCCSNKR